MNVQEEPLKRRPHSSLSRTKRQSTVKSPTGNDVVGPAMRQQWRDATGLPLLPDELPVSTVRDSLYDLIPLGPREEKLISTAPFLRLQKVKQLGFVYRVWPGATNTRYEHSLGCYYLAVRALRSLMQRGDDGGLYGVSISSVQTLVVAALLHDIGHYPFSHTIEELGYPVVSHEKVGRSIIEKSEIATILEHDYSLSPERVADFIDPPKKALPNDDELLCSLLSELSMWISLIISRAMHVLVMCPTVVLMSRDSRRHCACILMCRDNTVSL